MSSLISLGLLVAGIVLLIVLLEPLLRMLGKRWRFGARHIPAITNRARNALRLLVLVIGGQIAVGYFGDDDDSWSSAVDHALSVLLIVAIAWLLTGVTRGIQDVAETRLTESSGPADVRYRQAITQISLLRRLTNTIVVVIAAAAILNTFPSLDAISTGIFASAGLISIIAGIAAQTSLTNLFAGIQLAMSNELRVGDIVSIEGDSGTVKEITLTFVVVQLWQDRSLIFPTSFFITNPFENWTRSRDLISGSVQLDVDWSASIDDLRDELQRLTLASPYWDGRKASIRVIDALGGGPIRIQIDLSAEDTDALFTLEAYIREEMVKYLVRQGLYWLPRSRSESVSAPNNLNDVIDAL